MKNKVAFTTAAAGSFGATLAHAAIINAAINIDLSSNDSSVYIDVDTGNFSISEIAGQDIKITFLDDGFPYHAKASVDTYNGLSVFETGNYADRFTYGATLTGTGDGSFTQTESAPFGIGGWGGLPTGIAYLGFDKSGNKGWVELDYQAAAPGGSVEVRSFAYGTAGEITDAGVVPEPANAAAICALLAGSAAVFSRRRRTA